jgi:surface carbohydrate biosynthesis protein
MLLRQLPTPSILLHKSTWEARARKIQALGHYFVFLDEEMGVAIPRPNLFSTLEYRWGRFVSSDKYSAIFTLGPAYTRIANEVIADKKVDVVETGWPRFDVIQSGTERELEKLEKPGHKGVKYLVFASSFGPISYNAKKLKESLNSGSVTERDLTEQEVSLAKCITFLEKLSDLAPELLIIFRPHNAEAPAWWQEYFRQRKNIVVQIDQSLLSLVRNAVAVLHPCSTVGFEAHLCGIPSFVISPKSEMRDTIIFDVSREVSTPEKFLDIVRSPVCSGSVGYEVNRRIEDDLSGLTGPSACSRIVSYFGRFDLKSSGRLTFKNRTLLKFDALLTKSRGVLGNLWAYRGRERLDKLNKAEKIFTRSAIEKHVQTVKEGDSQLEKPTIKEVAPECFCIENEDASGRVSDSLSMAFGRAFRL